MFDTPGVLQLAWLFGHEPALARVRRPDVQALRAAGMFDVLLGERAAERAGGGAGEEAVGMLRRGSGETDKSV